MISLPVVLVILGLCLLLLTTFNVVGIILLIIGVVLLFVSVPTGYYRRGLW